MDKEQLEKYSSAITLSDMEVFVFPELMYSLVLANIMSPVIWRWREAECFKRLEGKSPYRKLMRLKQYVMDEYEFNLDLNTWGLTHKDIEMKRFEEFISGEDIARSNALFGYTGDKYYFDVDIRRHFGLDKYDGEIIPYWKTETVEAMDAFRLKEGYRTGAGECVSLSTLYAAAAFIVCGIPLEDIFMVLTPLHSQNFLDIQDGVLTNNRRIVTRPMWFNGTEISNKAQRALRNEQVTIIAHNSGWVHCLYDYATIDRKAYEKFTARLGGYLSGKLDALNFANFLRCHQEYQQYFQFCRHRRGEAMFVRAEVLFHYEHGSQYRIEDASFNRLLNEVVEEDYAIYKSVERLCCEQLRRFVEQEKIDIKKGGDREKLVKYISPYMPEPERLVADLYDFLHVEAKLPDVDKDYRQETVIELSTDQSREEIIDYLKGIRKESLTADLAFYACRDIENCRWEPFIKAAVERNPVSVEILEGKSVDEAYQWLCSLEEKSIYDGKRLAQPDEIANYGAGDGVEKAVLLASVIINRDAKERVEILINGCDVLLRAGRDYRFESSKGLKENLVIDKDSF